MAGQGITLWGARILACLGGAGKQCSVRWIVRSILFCKFKRVGQNMFFAVSLSVCPYWCEVYSCSELALSLCQNFSFLFDFENLLLSRSI